MSDRQLRRGGDREREPRGFDPAQPSSDDLRSGRRAQIARIFADLIAAGEDELAESLRFADPADRALLCRKYRWALENRDDDDDDDDAEDEIE